MTCPFKICDAVHGFIRFGEVEAKVIDSRPFQRLRYIHQMGVAYLVYPGATHTRFEHSLGVMELVSRIYDTLIAPHNQVVEIPLTKKESDYWRIILRLAALCHDMGHLPFSHTAERSLLPRGGHEEMTRAMICSAEMRPIWRQISEQAEADILKLALSHSPEGLTPWENILAQIITEDNFGADRIDYLIRDGSHTGVGYGYFDYHQLIDSLRILSSSIGVTASGIQSVESLWIARYMMYARVYHHPKSLAYSRHMDRFMSRHYEGAIDTSIASYLKQTDYLLLTALAQAADQGDPDAQALLWRTPFDRVNEKREVAKIGRREFPVLLEDGQIISSFEATPFLGAIPN